jgi:hypothetical protein
MLKSIPFVAVTTLQSVKIWKDRRRCPNAIYIVKESTELQEVTAVDDEYTYALGVFEMETIHSLHSGTRLEALWKVALRKAYLAF